VRGPLAGAGARSRLTTIAGFLLCLPIIQNFDVIGVRKVVGRCDHLGLVFLVPDIVARNPSAGPTEGLSVTEVQAMLQ
jgi:hypothetical protein